MARPKNILLFGAGKSATVLIRYLLEKCDHYNWTLTVVDTHAELLRSKLNAHPKGIALCFDIYNQEERNKAIGGADIVISMLPPALHFMVAKDCVAFKKNLLTASYLDENIRSLEDQINHNQLLFLGEMGLDPGIDHMSAMQIIDKIRSKGGVIHSFRSHCGGLIAPESDNNPWHYKITWNPANLVHAGKSGALYRKDNREVKIDYPHLFEKTETVEVPGLGRLAFYPNRNSLSYLPAYGLTQVPTFIRTTLRHPHFCTGWKYIIKAGLNSDTQLPGSHYGGTAIKKWFPDMLKQFSGEDSFADFLENQVHKADRQLVKEQFAFLGLLNDELIPEGLKTPVLQYLLETRLKLGQSDKDMIVMLHETDYELYGERQSEKSCMIVKGEDPFNTAMAKTVGLPLAIATELILTGRLSLTGLHIPVKKEIYQPVLARLKENGIAFKNE